MDFFGIYTKLFKNDILLWWAAVTGHIRLCHRVLPAKKWSFLRILIKITIYDLAILDDMVKMRPATPVQHYSQVPPHTENCNAFEAEREYKKTNFFVCRFFC